MLYKDTKVWLRTPSYVVGWDVEPLNKRIDDVIETYYQDPGYSFEFAYGIASFEGFKEAMKMAVRNAKEWGIHNV